MRANRFSFIIMGTVGLGVILGALYYQAQRDPMHDSLSELEETLSLHPAPGDKGAAHDSSEPSQTGSQQFPESNSDPDLSTEDSGLSKATLTLATSRGLIRFKLYTNDAPKSTARIVELVQNKFYHGLSFHKVLPNFAVQTGSPDGSQTGGSGQKLEAEFSRRRHVEGTIGLARGKDPDSADSQFYITLAPQPHLDGSYTVIGQVIEGMDVVRSIQQGDQILYLVIQ